MRTKGTRTLLTLAPQQDICAFHLLIFARSRHRALEGFLLCRVHLLKASRQRESKKNKSGPLDELSLSVVRGRALHRDSRHAFASGAAVIAKLECLQRTYERQSSKIYYTRNYLNILDRLHCLLHGLGLKCTRLRSLRDNTGAPPNTDLCEFDDINSCWKL
jgi:hypothetical protein